MTKEPYEWCGYANAYEFPAGKTSFDCTLYEKEKKVAPSGCAYQGNRLSCPYIKDKLIIFDKDTDQWGWVSKLGIEVDFTMTNKSELILQKVSKLFHGQCVHYERSKEQHIKLVTNTLSLEVYSDDTMLEFLAEYESRI